MPVYKVQRIDWQPQSDSLGVSPLKQTQSNFATFISGLHHLVDDLRQLTCFLDCFIRVRLQHLPYLIHLPPAFAHKPVHCTFSSEVMTRGTHTKSALSTYYHSQDSPCIHQCRSQYNWETSQPPVYRQGQAHIWDCAPSERVLGRSSAGASSDRNSSTRPRVWRGHQPSLLCHQIFASFGRRLFTFLFQLYHRLRWGSPISTQPNPDHCPHPQIGQPRTLTHPCHTSLSSPQGERLQQWHLHSRPTGSRCKQYKCEIHRHKDDSPTPIISKHQLCPWASLKTPHKYL